MKRADVLLEVVRDGLAPLRPPPRLSVAQWAKSYRRLSRRDTQRSGRWRSEPHQDAVMDAFSDPRVWKVVVMAASQVVGKTQMMNNVLGYFIDHDPSNIMVMHPTLDAAERWSKGRFDPLITETPRLRDKINPRRARDSENTILHRQFRGGQLFVVGANSPAGLAAQSVRVLLRDEVDRYEASAGQEGDPLDLAEQRTETYWNRKIGDFSTPTIAGISRIEAAFLESDQRTYELRCPHAECRAYVVVEWEHVHWDKDETRSGRARHSTETAAVHCPACGARWSEPERRRAIEAGRWRPTAPFTGIAGFRINAFACRRANIPALAARWVRARGNPEREKAFVNLVCARTWEERGEAPEAERLYERRETYRRGIVPARGLVLTAGVDAQRDRLEVEVVAWGPGLESWSVDYIVLPGDPARDEVWRELGALMNRPWPREGGGEARIERLAIDSGFETQAVYAFRRRVGDARVILVKGTDRLPQPLGLPAWTEVTAGGRRVSRGVKLWPVGVSYLKGEFYGWLKQPMPDAPDQPAPRFCHFPQYGREHFDQLTAEELVTRVVRGYPRREWVKVRPRNEALDCRIYARAAAAHLGLDRWSEERWAEREALVVGGGSPAAAPVPRPQAGATPAATPERWEQESRRPADIYRRPTDGWLDRGRGGWLQRRSW
jgi:phage terminase large subunit GpA-like protein